MSYLRLLSLILLSILWMGQGHAEVLDSQDALLYKEIFSLSTQENQLKQLTAKAKEIQNPVLMGYVLYQKYFTPGYKTTKQEIKEWMQDYSDYPVATEIYALGRQKKVANLERPTGLFGGNTHACESIVRLEPNDLTRGLSFSGLPKSKRIQSQKIIRQFNRYLMRGNTLNAKNFLSDKNTQNALDKKTLANARTALAFSYFLDGQDKLALEQLKQAEKNKNHPLTDWLTGLVAWRQGNYEQAAVSFIATNNNTQEASLASSSAYWAARALMRLGYYSKVGEFLEIAAEYPRHFYGVLAARTLGRSLDHSWEEPIYADEDIASSYSHPALERFYALREVGQEQWAIEELSKLYIEADSEGREVLWAISKEHGFESDLKGLTGVLNGENTRYPIPNWTPENSWQLDKSLVYSFVRQESCFNQRAESMVGALGLMQLMPSTAKELAKNLQCDFKTKKLKNPIFNLTLGQTYLQQLLDNSLVRNNLMKLAVAYNAGPGNLHRWEKKMSYQNDPLLFLESIPSKETRTFVERILVNYWIYQSLIGEGLSSLDELVNGSWPIYQRCSV